MVWVCRLTDYSLVDCAVSAEERWSLSMVDVERGAWWLVTSRQKTRSDKNHGRIDRCLAKINIVVLK